MNEQDDKPGHVIG